MIKVVGLHKSFPMGGEPLHVLKGIDLEIARGEMLCIVGASGVGKSTFLHLLGTLDRPTEGTVSFEGLDVFSLKENEMARFRNRKIGFVFQFHHLLPEFTALENAAMPALIQGMNRRDALEKARALLEEVGLRERTDHRPGELSGGEQQRVAVARALFLHPDVVLADEPTGNLDTRTGEEVFGLIQRLRREKGTTFVVVTHNEGLASRADRIAKMVDGRIEKILKP